MIQLLRSNGPCHPIGEGILKKEEKHGCERGFGHSKGHGGEGRIGHDREGGSFIVVEVGSHELGQGRTIEPYYIQNEHARVLRVVLDVMQLEVIYDTHPRQVKNKRKLHNTLLELNDNGFHILRQFCHKHRI